ncbi:hypothetical protein QBC35DRAFT_68903 [Podospora australis]|uniref:DUF4470 domain-containing protein n=1 Tax=Podospora australis TaxID=1536484 RepID=A0AAN6WMI5_9PEZI|nr:hypothetical protein QBC35DRAFT_68903 [Podospora australis]
MLGATYINTFTPFHPFGGKPAVCLTDNTPIEKPARILMLGCGDLRNVLFTAHSDGAGRHLDFTLCDMEVAIIARNIILFTLIIDDAAGNHHDANWTIFYHQYLSAKDHARLVAQAKKLHGFAASWNSWQTSQYGKLIRYCDRTTLTKVDEVWQF